MPLNKNVRKNCRRFTAWGGEIQAWAFSANSVKKVANCSFSVLYCSYRMLQLSDVSDVHIFSHVVKNCEKAEKLCVQHQEEITALG
jgi:hypothetical protein